MPTQEIKDSNWQKFCDHFEELHRGTLISLEVVDHDGATAFLAKEQPLRAFRFEKALCNDLINLELGEAPGPTIQHQIIAPIHVRLREKAENLKELEIDAESGSIEMRFTSGNIGDLLDHIDVISPEELGREGGRVIRQRQ